MEVDYITIGIYIIGHEIVVGGGLFRHYAVYKIEVAYIYGAGYSDL